MLEAALQRIINRKLTTAREIGEMAGVSTSTVYRWISGQSQPDFNSIRLLVRHLPDRRAQEAILSAFVAGTAWQLRHLELELDVNEDGTIDADDALDAAIDAVKAAAKTLQQVRSASRQRGLSAEQTIEVLALLNQVARHCTVTERVLVQLAERQRRKKLKLVK